MLFIQRCPALLANSDLAIAAHFVSDPHRTAGRAHQGDVRQRNRPLLLGDTAFDVLLRIRAYVLLHHHHVLDQHIALVRKHAQYAPFFTRIPAGHHLNVVVPANINSFVFFCSRSSHLESPILNSLAAPLFPKPKALPAPATRSSRTSSRAVRAPPDPTRGCPPARRFR